MKKWILFLAFALTLGTLAACGSDDTSSEDTKDITIGATSGPFSDMVTKAIKPGLEEKGYKVEVKEFSDYIQPNNALAQGDLDANLFQNKVYYESFAKENDMELSEVISVPTAPMGIFSNEFESIDDITDGSEIALPNDPTNSARALLILEDVNLITIDPEANPLTLSEKDVVENVKNLQFKPLEAAQLPRAVDSVALSAVPGNYALAANLDLNDAVQLENMADMYRNRVVMNTKDIDSQLAKDIKEVVESEQFEKVIDEEFIGFGKPEWMANR